MFIPIKDPALSTLSPDSELFTETISKKKGRDGGIASLKH